VQTLEHAPAFVHGGPFANIAHGCNSVLATRTALKLADIVVTEAGFGSDLGAEKFIDIKCRKSGLRPDAVVLVATVRALKYHGGVALPDLEKEDVLALRRGFPNMERHLTNLREVFGLPAVVAINRFPSDTDAEVQAMRDLAYSLGCPAYSATHFAHGAAGAEALAWGVLDELKAGAPNFRFAYPDEGTVEEKATAVATRLYGAAGVNFAARARKQLAQIVADGFGDLPVCVAKTQFSFTTDPKALGAPKGHTIDVREVRLSAGAGFIVLVTGDIMTMPGLPKSPASAHIDVDDHGVVTGLS
jgi:formate--tetrahydrofolate ligase